MLVSAMAILLYMRVDQIMVANLSGYVEVGVFSAAVRLTELWYFIPVALMTALFPMMVTARASGDGAADDRRTALLFGAMGGLASCSPHVRPSRRRGSSASSTAARSRPRRRSSPCRRGWRRWCSSASPVAAGW